MIEEMIIKIKEAKDSGLYPESLALLFGKYKIHSGIRESIKQIKNFKTK